MDGGFLWRRHFQQPIDAIEHSCNSAAGSLRRTADDANTLLTSATRIQGVPKTSAAHAFWLACDPRIRSLVFELHSAQVRVAAHNLAPFEKLLAARSMVFV